MAGEQLWHAVAGRCGDTVDGGDPSSVVPLRTSSTSSSTSASRSASTRSRLVEYDESVADAEEIEDGEVLARLRHH